MNEIQSLLEELKLFFCRVNSGDVDAKWKQKPIILTRNFV